MKCERNCPGTIEDGYCDTCGMAPASGSATGGSATGGGNWATAGTTPRQRTGDTSPSARTGALSTRTGSSGRTGSSRTGSRRRRFGGGLVDVTPIVQADPATAVMSTAEVPEEKRYCAKCGNPVGRSRGERQGRASGFCPSCGEPFNFTP